MVYKIKIHVLDGFLLANIFLCIMMYVPTRSSHGRIIQVVLSS